MEANPSKFIVEHKARCNDLFGKVERADSMLLQLFKIDAVFKQQINRVLVELFRLDVVVKIKLPG